MPKRPSPSGDIAPVQLKIHVGQKELSQGVCGHKYKKEIYEKTRKLLFSGAQTFMWNSKPEGNCALNQGQEEICGAFSLMQGQALIGLDGKLSKNSLASQKAVGMSKACSVCRRLASIREACRLCDQFLCCSCSGCCSSCRRVCCSLCSVTDYSERYEKLLCCDCSTFGAY
ncbi:apoptosis regulatory protein Siva isoform X2 [Latimeria chalumnae]|uniref:apoptosis regulatory protein Siva isoform X2 n=1 Tax=Latimeria chalumnae TaxID=7897 RepID=UPI00313EA03E